MYLTDKEKEILSKFNKHAKTMYLNYIGVGLFVCMSIYGFVRWTEFKGETDLFTAIFCGSLGAILFLTARKHEKLYKIILKMETYIAELEKRAG